MVGGGGREQLLSVVCTIILAPFKRDFQLSKARFYWARRLQEYERIIGEDCFFPLLSPSHKCSKNIPVGANSDSQSHTICTMSMNLRKYNPSSL